MSGFGWIADAVGPAQSLVGLGLVLLLTAFVATQVSRRAINLQQGMATQMAA
jgi:DHA3 family macrolide efflux protein-like MFS transporter